jgi:Zn ribbon nucleic-acid-binding protein
MQTACEHKNTIVLARRDGVDYVECVDCRQIFEAEDLEPVAADNNEEES